MPETTTNDTNETKAAGESRTAGTMPFYEMMANMMALCGPRPEQMLDMMAECGCRPEQAKATWEACCGSITGKEEESS